MSIVATVAAWLCAAAVVAVAAGLVAVVVNASYGKRRHEGD